MLGVAISKFARSGERQLPKFARIEMTASIGRSLATASIGRPGIFCLGNELKRADRIISKSNRLSGMNMQIRRFKAPIGV